MSTPGNWGRGRLSNGAVWCAAAVLFSVTTLGPLYTLRFRFGPAVVGSLLDDKRLNAVFTTVHLGVITVGLLVALARRRGAAAAGSGADRPGGHTWARLVWIVALVALHVLVAWSAAWSLVEDRSLTQAGLFALTSASALALGNVVTMRQLTSALVVSQHALLLWGMWAVRRDWVGAVDERGHWTGVFLNKNSFGPVAAVALLSLIALFAWVAHRSSRAGVLVCAPFALAAAGLDGLVLIRANSITPMVGIIGAFGAVAVVALAATVAARRSLPRARTAYTFAAIAVAGAVAGGLAARSLLASVLHRSPTMSGRTELWGWLFDRIAERPVGGWGWLSVWEEPDLKRQVVARFKIPFATAHSGVIEVAIGAGLIAAACAAIVLGGCAILGIRSAAERPSWATYVGLGALGYALSVNLLETFIGANLLPWSLLLCVAAVLAATARSASTTTDGQTGNAAAPGIPPDTADLG